MTSKSRFRSISRYAIAAAALVAMSSPAHALTFVLNFTPGTSAQAQAGFQAAANRWSSIFTDNATVTLTVGTAALGAGILGQAGSVTTNFSYSAFKTALTADITSASDALGVANLDPGSSFGMLINRTSDNPNGSGSATPYLDLAGANNQQVRLTNANAKALGLTPTLGTNSLCLGTCDAGIQFSTNFAFDYDPSDGITAGQFDFVGIATHEIGHSLGFISGVDILDGNSPPVNGPFLADQFTFVTSLDLFRYSALSTAAGVIDWTADTRAKYFSLDGGLTVGPGFSTGRNFGDGQQNSHWKDGLGIGIMDPTAAPGESLAISANDRLGFDVIGWNLAAVTPAVPEPSTWMMMLAGFGLVGGAARRRAKSQIAAIA